MDVYKKSLLTFCIVIVSNVSFSQSKDSVSQKVLQYTADKFPATRALNIEFGAVTPFKYTSKWRETALPESEVTDLYQVALNSNINFIRKERWMLGGSFGYKYTSVTAEATDPDSGLNGIYERDYHYHTSSLNFTYFSKLFNKRAIYSSTLTVDGSEKHFERIKGMLTATVVLKADARTKMMVGLLVNIDPSTQFPVIPTFIYEHRFANGLIADITLPRHLMIRKNVFTNGRVSLGSELDRTSFYLYDLDDTSQKYEFRQLEINSGITYEHLIANYFILTAKAGAKIIPTARIFEKEESFDSYIFDADPDPSFYFNIGVSFNPFVKRK